MALAALAVALGVGVSRRAPAAAQLFAPMPPVSSIDRDYTQLLSPNWNFRPAGDSVDCVVLHSTAMDSLQSVVARFLDPATKVSAHFVVDKDGAVIEMVPVAARAWHAGVSSLGGVANVNDYSVGIEMVNRNDGADPYTDAQYLAVARIIVLLRRQYDIPDDRIVSHAAVALPPGRKSDPRGFDFGRLRQAIAYESVQLGPGPDASDPDGSASSSGG